MLKKRTCLFPSVTLVTFLFSFLAFAAFLLGVWSRFWSLWLQAQNQSRASRNVEFEPSQPGAVVERVGLCEVFHRLIHVAVASIACIVAIHHAMVLSCRCQEAIVAERLHGIEVEHKHQVATHVGKHLVIVLVPQLANGQCLEVVQCHQ